MKRLSRLILVLVLLAAFLPVGGVSAQPLQQTSAPSCETFALPGSMVVSGEAPSTAKYCIIVPPEWSGSLVVFAHGYVFAYPADKPVEIPWDQLVLKDPNTGEISGSIPTIILQKGFAFATTSYSKNGLAVKEGVAGVLELVNIFKSLMSANFPGVDVSNLPVFLIGASEGGLVTTLAVERHPEVFLGGVEACGPVGDFRAQVDYWGDLRVIYDVYFKGNGLGANAFSIPPGIMNTWGSLTAPGPILKKNYHMITADLNANGLNTQRLLNAAQAPIDPLTPATIYQTILGVLEYNVMATNEAIQELGGNPYSNIGKMYATYPPDSTLNDKVQRVAADPAALAEIDAYYQTNGRLDRPLVMLHTTGDPIVPFWHVRLYQQKAAQSAGLVSTIAVTRYGHCAFTADEASAAFQKLLSYYLP